MKKKLFAALMLVSIPVSAFVTDYVHYLPLKGWALKPGKEHFYVQAYTKMLNSQHTFNSSGDKITLTQYFNIAGAQPHITKNIHVLDASLGLSSRFGVQVIVPYVTNYRLHANGSGENEGEMLVGDSGIGDIDLILWFGRTQLSRGRFVFSGRYHMTNGTSPYRLSSTDGITGVNQPLATGLGYSYLSLDVKGDVRLYRSIWLSGMAGYRYNRYFVENGYEATSKMGDIVTLAARAKYEGRIVTASLATGWVMSLKNISEGYEREGTDRAFVSLFPQIGVSVPWLSFVDLIHAGYVIPLAGKNIVSTDYFVLGVDFKF
ncbi:MAG: hypothetical protein D6814_09495 [Calditrichaeota bacterium]|nr:MAG: hypothetical protein D6814_09495 [Calditrichota bacterium]